MTNRTTELDNSDEESTPDLYLSYSGRRYYLICPRWYQYKYILKYPEDLDPRTSLFGSMIGKLFEWFYEYNIWQEDDPLSIMLSLVPRSIEVILEEENFDINEDRPYIENIRNELKETIPMGIETIRNHKLISPNSIGEMKLNVIIRSLEYGLTLKMGGRSDFVHYYSPRDVWILDGKASRHRDKYVDPEQIIWYGVQHYLKYGVAPSRLGFIYWRFPEDPVQWIEYTSDDIRSCYKKTFEVARRIILEMFDPRPSPECERCPFRERCPEGKEYAINARIKNNVKVESSIFDLEKLT